MGLDPDLAPLVDWVQLANGRHRVVRMDILATREGLAICEMNFSAAVGGGELHRFYQAYSDALGDWPAPEQPAPLDNLAHMYAQTCQQIGGIERLHLLDWSSHARLGYPSSDITRAHLRRKLPDLDVEIHDELSWRRQHRRGMPMDRVLVHRRFTHDDVTDNGHIYQQMLDSGVHFSNGLEAELLMSKGWLALLWDPECRKLLPADEIAAIDTYLIPTYEIKSVDKADILERKDDLLFKKKNGYGGLDMVLGRAMDAKALWQMLESTGTGDWVYQPFLDVPELCHLASDGDGPAPHRMVLGLYLHQGLASGVVTRSARDTLFVNAGSGACAGWAPVLNPEQRESLMESIRRFAQLNQP